MTSEGHFQPILFYDSMNCAKINFRHDRMTSSGKGSLISGKQPLCFHSRGSSMLLLWEETCTLWHQNSLFLTGSVENNTRNYESDREKHFPEDFTSNYISAD